jgi:mRNA interferase MazF
VNAAIRRGSVVSVRFDPGEGSEIRKTRPAVVISNDAACRFDAVIQVVPITGLPDRDLSPYESRVASRDSGVARPSRAVANQIRTISKQRVGKLLGQLGPEEQSALDRALEVQLSLCRELRNA